MKMHEAKTQNKLVKKQSVSLIFLFSTILWTNDPMKMLSIHRSSLMGSLFFLETNEVALNRIPSGALISTGVTSKTRPHSAHGGYIYGGFLLKGTKMALLIILWCNTTGNAVEDPHRFDWLVGIIITPLSLNRFQQCSHELMEGKPCHAFIDRYHSLLF